MTDSILIVDDEDSVRRTMAEWLTASGLPVTVTAVADAAAALVHANGHTVDLAVLDWNLGTGSDGLKLLEDLVEFQPNLVAILVTGFAARATPLQALRMGVRDYLDKNADFTRDAFVAAVRKQLAAIGPAKRQREIHERHAAFRTACENVLPLVSGAAKLHEPVSLPEAVRALVRFAVTQTGAADGAILSFRRWPDGSERVVAFAADGSPIDGPFPPFARTLAASVHAIGRPQVVAAFDSLGPVDLLPFERGRKSALLVPFAVGPGLHVTLELFDKTAFSEADRATAAACADIGTELVRHIVAERTAARTLVEAIEAALRTTVSSADVPTATAAMTRTIATESPSDGPDPIPLLEAVRDLARRHGPRSVESCTAIVREMTALLDHAVGAGT